MPPFHGYLSQRDASQTHHVILVYQYILGLPPEVIFSHVKICVAAGVNGVDNREYQTDSPRRCLDTGK